MRRAIVALAACCVACTEPRATQDWATSGVGSATDGGEADDGDEDGPIAGDDKLDVGAGGGMADAGDGEQGCRGIDFVFVVDNSGSMYDEQINLTTSFPGFVAAIEDKVEELGAADFHVLVLDTDSILVPPPGPYCSLECANGASWCQSETEADVPCAFSEDPTCHAICSADLDGTCESGLTCREALGCAECGCGLGHGRVEDNAHDPCGVEGGQRYLQDGQTDLGGTFACIAEVGTKGSGDEKQAGALVSALGPSATAADGCNAGFVRGDAILVVTIITDEEDQVDGGSEGDPAAWYDAVVAAKNGDPEAVVVLGLLGDHGQPNALCPEDAGGSGIWPPRLAGFVQSFPRHVIGSVCEPSYDAFFAQAVDLVETTCETYTPPEG